VKQSEEKGRQHFHALTHAAELLGVAVLALGLAPFFLALSPVVEESGTVANILDAAKSAFDS
jgi:hypothetical protein